MHYKPKWKTKCLHNNPCGREQTVWQLNQAQVLSMFSFLENKFPPCCSQKRKIDPFLKCSCMTVPFPKQRRWYNLHEPTKCIEQSSLLPWIHLQTVCYVFLWNHHLHRGWIIDCFASSGTSHTNFHTIPFPVCCQLRMLSYVIKRYGFHF